MFSIHVHGTTRLEGNQLSLEEVSEVLDNKQTPGKTLTKDVREVANFLRCRDFLENYQGEINESLIKKIHTLIMDGLDGESAGKYRSEKVSLKNVFFQPPDPELVEIRMQHALSEYNQRIINNIHPIEVAAKFHQQFEEIHPFSDGNGRCGREILNLILKKGDLPQIFITQNSEKEYYAALENGNTGNLVDMINFVTWRVGATIMFFYSKTKVYEYWVSQEMRQMFVMSGQGMLYDLISTELEKYRGTLSIP